MHTVPGFSMVIRQLVFVSIYVQRFLEIFSKLPYLLHDISAAELQCEECYSD